MNTFKKKLFALMIVVTLVLNFCLAASAQNHISQSFLASGITSVTVSNTVSPTNFSYAALTYKTNCLNLSFTNQGTLTISTNAAKSQISLFDDVTLWPEAGGRPWSTNVALANVFESPVTLTVRTAAESGANGTVVTLVFAPVYNDTVGETTTTTTWFTATLTIVASTTQVHAVAVPTYRWPGAKKLRLLYSLNSDTDASSAVRITHASLDGFRP